MRYKVVVYADRGAGAYVYTQYDRVKASKVGEVLQDTAMDIIAHETHSSGRLSAFRPYLTGRYVEVNTNGHVIRFIVKAWRL